MSRATCGSSSTTRIIAIPLCELYSQTLPCVAECGAAERAEDVPGEIEPAGDAGRQRELPRVDRRAKRERGQRGEEVRATPRPIVAIGRQKREEAPRNERE